MDEKPISWVLLISNVNGEQNEIFVLGFLYLIILHLLINVKSHEMKLNSNQNFDTQN